MASYQPQSSVDADWSSEAVHDQFQEKARKFQSLIINDTYKVKGKRPINTKHGKTYILLVTHLKTSIDFDLFATKMITTYIDSGKDLTGGFIFKVKYDENTKFKSAVIPGYEPFYPSPFTLF